MACTIIVSTLSGLNFSLYRDKLENTEKRKFIGELHHTANYFRFKYVLRETAASVVVTNAEENPQEVSDSKCNHRQQSYFTKHQLCSVYLWANPRDMALISLGGSPVIRASIWLLMHLMSSATAGLWTQLRSSFSWKTPKLISDPTLS